MALQDGCERERNISPNLYEMHKLSHESHLKFILVNHSCKPNVLNGLDRSDTNVQSKT